MGDRQPPHDKRILAPSGAQPAQAQRPLRGSADPIAAGLLGEVKFVAERSQ